MNTRIPLRSFAAMLAAAAVAPAAPEVRPAFPNSDFEKGGLENWTAEGTAFEHQPTKGDNPTRRGRPDASKHKGEFWIGTYEAYNGSTGNPGKTQGDGPTGRLSSIPFTIRHDYLNFLVGGGSHAATSVRLLVDGKTYHLSSGFDSETMRPVSAKVETFKGKGAQIVLLDNATGGWGHLNADHFTISDAPIGGIVEPRETERATLRPPRSNQNQLREFTVTEPYLIYPINNGAPGSTISLSLDGEVVRFYSAGLAASPDDIDWWAFEDLTAMMGNKLTLAISGLSDEVFELITQAAAIPGQETWGDEPLRPQFHFSQKVGWINDPNGMVYYDGEWHLFFQHNPVGWKWGNMTWGHAVSEDLVNWKQLPNTLHHRRGDAMFSGGAAVDWKNTGGWKTGDDDVIIITWTSTGRGECIAYSNDRGRTFTEYEGNPIITHDGRDPKPLWYAYSEGDTPLSPEAEACGGHWVIVVFSQSEELGGHLAFHTSTDLKTWDLQSQRPGYHECPELFALPVDGDENDTRWVLFGGDAKYVIGEFDGREFTPGHKGKHQLHWGNFYASQVFSDAPDGRRVQIGWARGVEMNGMPFNQAFSFPTELSLRTTAEGVRLFGEPVEEIGKIHGQTHRTANQPLGDGQTVKLATSGHLFDIRATFEVGTAKRLGLNIDGKEAFAYDAANRSMKGAKLEPVDARIGVRVLIDRSLIETYVNDGRMIITGPFENSLNIDHIEAFATGGEAKLVSLEIKELNP